jgi:putative transposase
LLQEEFPHLKKRYWGQHMWGRGYFCASVGSVTEETIKEYIATQQIEEAKEDFTVVDEFQS